MRFVPQNAFVWIEIPVRDLKAGMAFYEAVTGGRLEIQDAGPNLTAVFEVADPESGIAGHLYEGTPAADGRGPTLHLAVEGKLEAAMARLTAAGGTLLGAPIEIPPGRFVYAKDPDGNSIGLFTRHGV